jgi:serine/threonine protein kinase
VKYQGRPSLLIEDRGGEFLDKLIDGPMAVPEFLRLASGIAKALGCLHAKGLVHRDIKPANVIVDMATGEARLTGFGLASRLPRQRQAPDHHGRLWVTAQDGPGASSHFTLLTA